MNYYIEKHDMEIILDALANFVQDMKHAKDNGYLNYPYSIEYVDGLFQSFDNSNYEDQMTIAEQVMKADKEAVRRLARRGK